MIASNGGPPRLLATPLQLLVAFGDAVDLAHPTLSRAGNLDAVPLQPEFPHRHRREHKRRVSSCHPSALGFCAMGGTTTWANILSACVECTKRKRDRPADWSGRKRTGLRPLKPPRRPTTMELLRAGLEFLDPEIKESYGSWLYWSSELQA